MASSRSNATLSPLQVVLRYRDSLQVEDLFRRAKAILRTRPIFHSPDAVAPKMDLPSEDHSPAVEAIPAKTD